MAIDLHIHTSFSDGRLMPSEVVKEAARVGLQAIAITDHDVVGGVSEAIEVGKRVGIEVVSGVELTCDWAGRTAHLLGYFIDAESPPLVKALERAKALMLDHVAEVVKGLAEEGHALQMDELEKYRTRYVTGASLILAMLQRGILRRSPRARHWLSLAGQEPRGYTLSDGIELIHAAGGLASLAHPIRLIRGKPLLEPGDLELIVSDGLDALEVWQYRPSPPVREHYGRLASELGLLATGGSDWHGARSSRMQLGEQPIPYGLLSEMKLALAGRDSREPTPGRT